MDIATYKKKIPLSQLKKSLDNFWSATIKSRDRQCVVCGKRDGLNAHHIFSRSKTATRFDLDNGITFCKGHHYFGIHKWNQKYTMEYVIPKLGQEKYNELYRKSNTIQKCSREFLEQTIKILQEFTTETVVKQNLTTPTSK
jgi:hypothetical protein